MGYGIGVAESSILKAVDEKELRPAVLRLQQAEELLGSFITVPMNEAAAQEFAILRQHKKAKKMRRTDMLIACIALASKALLVTRNTKDFKDVPGLRIENWAD